MPDKPTINEGVGKPAGDVLANDRPSQGPLHVSDVDMDSLGNLQVTLTVTQGKLTLSPEEDKDTFDKWIIPSTGSSPGYGLICKRRYVTVFPLSGEGGPNYK